MLTDAVNELRLALDSNDNGLRIVRLMLISPWMLTWSAQETLAVYSVLGTVLQYVITTPKPCTECSHCSLAGDMRT